jgi:hypothetical protein
MRVKSLMYDFANGVEHTWNQSLPKLDSSNLKNLQHTSIYLDLGFASSAKPLSLP